MFVTSPDIYLLPRRRCLPTNWSVNLRFRIDKKFIFPTNDINFIELTSMFNQNLFVLSVLLLKIKSLIENHTICLLSAFSRFFELHNLVSKITSARTVGVTILLQSTVLFPHNRLGSLHAVPLTPLRCLHALLCLPCGCLFEYLDVDKFSRRLFTGILHLQWSIDFFLSIAPRRSSSKILVHVCVGFPAITMVVSLNMSVRRA